MSTITQDYYILQKNEQLKTVWGREGVIMESAETILLESLTRFYDDPRHANVLSNILAPSGKPLLSLRVLDWCVVSYAKKRNIAYMLPQEKRVFDIYREYKLQLRSFSKRLFDSFRRSERIVFDLGKGKTVETTIAQLNFLRWSIRYGIIDFCLEHLEDIEKDIAMHATVKKDDQKKMGRSADMSVCTIIPMNVRVTFD